MSSFRILFALALLSLVRGECDICAGNGGITCPNTILRIDGQTCAGMAEEAMDTTGEMCQDYQVWGAACCVAECPPDLAIPPSTPAPVEGIVSGAIGVAGGEHAPCHLCLDGSKPNDPYHIIHVLYIGQGTCQQYYEIMLNGDVVNHRCAAISFFAQEPCKCGIPTPQPTPHPNQIPAPAPPSSGSTPVRKNPVENKSNVKLSNNRGGAGAQFHGGRRLKGKGRRQARFALE